jgi:formylmethanofuran dehydrogenase subunit E
VVTAICTANEPPVQLPQPQYHKNPSDPAWLEFTVQIHGHLGPSVVAGARMGMAGLRAVDAKGYFDIEVWCEGPMARPPQSCFLDGLQLGTGATLGKRNLQWTQADQIVVRVKNTRTGRTAELRPTPALLAILTGLAQQAEADGQDTERHEPFQEHLEAAARKIASLPEGEVVSIMMASEVTP